MHTYPRNLYLREIGRSTGFRLNNLKLSDKTMSVQSCYYHSYRVLPRSWESISRGSAPPTSCQPPPLPVGHGAPLQKQPSLNTLAAASKAFINDRCIAPWSFRTRRVSAQVQRLLYSLTPRSVTYSHVPAKADGQDKLRHQNSRVSLIRQCRSFPVVCHVQPPSAFSPTTGSLSYSYST